MSTTNRTGGSRSYASSGRGDSRSSGGGSRSGGSAAGRSGGSTVSRSGSSTVSRSSSGAGSRSASAQRSTSGSSRTGYQSSGTTYRSYRKKKKPSPDYRIIAIIGVILILVIAAVAFAMTQHPGRSGVREEETSQAMETSAEESETELEKQVTVDHIPITGMSRDQAREAILKNYPWSMKAVYDGDVYELVNLMSGKVDLLLEEIFTGTPKEQYTLDTSGLEDAVATQVASMRDRWNRAAKNGTIDSYDAGSDSFTFAEGQTGIAIDEEKLTADILQAITAKQFDAQIQVTASSIEPEISKASAQSIYQIIGTYTTNTTANSKRNTNVKLAAQQLNGTIVQPGEELSFNDTVGERTEAKGYQAAAAYNNGEVVQEIGGGVCQVSTTLYNAVLKAGMKISRRQSHTFEPSYVTPGMDATVSWGGPDFRFINTSKAAIGIKANYHDQTVTVSVYGIPVLEDGVTYSLESTKLGDLDPPAPTYEEDQTVPLDQEIVVSEGSNGSRWETRLVIKKNGEVISREVDHTTSYKGHAAVIKRNTSGVVLTPEGETSIPDPSAGLESQPPAESVPVGPGGYLPSGAGPGGAATDTQAVFPPNSETDADGDQNSGPNAAEESTSSEQPTVVEPAPF